MVEKAVIIAAGKGSRLKDSKSDLPKPLVKVAGVSLLKRTILSAMQAGVREFVIVIGYRGEEVQKEIQSDFQIAVHIDWVLNSDWESGNGTSVLKAQKFVQGPFLLLMSDHLFDPEAIARVQSLPLSEKEVRVCVDFRIKSIFDLEDATKILLDRNRILQIGKELVSFNAIDTGIFLCGSNIFNAIEDSVATGDGSLSGGIRALVVKKKMSAVDISDLFWSDIDTPESLIQAEHALINNLGKLTDGFVSRHFNRKFSRQITQYLVNISVTPNQMSVLTMFISFLAAWCVSFGDGYLPLALGGVLFQFSSIVDGCDGEIAALKFMKSRLGEWLDTLADNVSYLTFFFAIVYRMYWVTGQPFFLTLGGALIVLDILGVLFMFFYMQAVGSGSILSFNLGFSIEVPKTKQGWFHEVCSSIKFVSRRDFFSVVFCIFALVNSVEGMYWFFIIGSTLLCAGIFSYGGQMLRSRGVWGTEVSSKVEIEPLVSETSDLIDK